MPNIFQRAGTALKHAWTVFNGRDRPFSYADHGPVTVFRPDKPRRRFQNDRTIISAIYNRIALDVTGIEMHHVKLDENRRFIGIVNDGLEKIMSLEANLDQTRFAYSMDLVLSMFDEGVVAEVPVECDMDPQYTSGFDILQMRTGKILEWKPRSVRLRVYNDRTGHQEEIELPKDKVGIIENPFHSVMNEPMGVLQRLLHKMSILDAIDDQNGSNKLNMILQLPYVVRTEAQKATANKRITQIEDQLGNSKYGITYTDGTEKIVQLNRPLDNNLMAQIEYLTNMLYSQLGITATILDGTADEKTMLNYYNRTVEPILSAIANERKRKFLSKTARTKGESILYFRDPFKLTPVLNLADVADKLTRNRILTANEFRAILGYMPSDDPVADTLNNANMPLQDQETMLNPALPQNDSDTGEQPYA